MRKRRRERHTDLMESKPPTNTQRDLVLASLRRGVGRDNCAGGRHGQGARAPKPGGPPPGGSTPSR
jgi:hypothetical protein